MRCCLRAVLSPVDGCGCDTFTGVGYFGGSALGLLTDCDGSHHCAIIVMRSEKRLEMSEVLPLVQGLEDCAELLYAYIYNKRQICRRNFPLSW